MWSVLDFYQSLFPIVEYQTIQHVLIPQHWACSDMVSLRQLPSQPIERLISSQRKRAPFFLNYVLIFRSVSKTFSAKEGWILCFFFVPQATYSWGVRLTPTRRAFDLVTAYAHEQELAHLNTCFRNPLRRSQEASDFSYTGGLVDTAGEAGRLVAFL